MVELSKKPSRLTKFKLWLRKYRPALLSGVVVVGSCAYIGASTPFEKLLRLEPNQFGDTLAGVAATLAFIWLSAGYFQQSKELRLQRRELRLQRKQLRLQRKELKIQNKETTRLADAAAYDLILRTVELAKPRFQELGHVLVYYWTRAHSPELKEQYDSGDRDSFLRELDAWARYKPHFEDAVQHYQKALRINPQIKNYSLEFRRLFRIVRGRAQAAGREHEVSTLLATEARIVGFLRQVARESRS